MKFSALLLSWVSGPLRERNLRPFFFLLALFFFMVAIYSILFHVIMGWEGQDYSWITSIYWTVVTMSTLGYGDIVFRSGLGQIFSMVVLLSGSTIILVLLPFTFIQFVFTPWMQRRESQRTPRKVDDNTEGHIILTRLGSIEESLVERAKRSGVPYVIVESSYLEAGVLHDKGYCVMVGDLDNPETYKAAGVDRAALVVATHADPTNANIGFTVREVADTEVVATAASREAIDILELAGVNVVFQLGELLGQAFAERILSPSGAAHILYRRRNMCVAETTVMTPKLVDVSISESAVRERTGCSLIGVWRQGKLDAIKPDVRLSTGDVLVLAGLEENISAFNEEFSIAEEKHADEFVVIIGCGRVGRALSNELVNADISHSVIDKSPQNLAKLSSLPVTTVCGDASDLEVLKDAGIERASTVVVTTHDDDINIYLTLYVNKLLDNVELLSRSHLQRNISTLYRAGADMVLSYGSMGSDFVWQSFRSDDTILLAEGLEVFQIMTPPQWDGKRVDEIDDLTAKHCVIAGREMVSGKVSSVTGEDVLRHRERLWVVGDSSQLLDDDERRS